MGSEDGEERNGSRQDLPLCSFFNFSVSCHLHVHRVSFFVLVFFFHFVFLSFNSLLYPSHLFGVLAFAFSAIEIKYNDDMNVEKLCKKKRRDGKRGEGQTK